MNKSNNFILCYYNVSGYRSKNVRANLSGVDIDGNYEYLNENKYEYPNNSTSYLNSTNTSSKLDYTKVYARVTYETYTDTDPSITRKTMTYKEEMLTLKKDEIEEISGNDFDNNKLIFGSVKITEYPSSDTQNRVVCSFSFSEELKKIFHFDFQTFAVGDDGTVYPLVGYYNLSNISTRTYSRTAYLATNVKVKYYIAKGIFTDSEGVVKTYYYKQTI